ncbi:suppressor of SWI4 1 homolog [Stegostoma tigrinum]|uniref:suppressor of SWI4 1 homolog n=1 Tax=Stegostoma tigrinum TaxID=3053191 RepID=UPI00286FEA13|nr:suppressor of SWI4 1 homolog [Stegostoma tigrinum]
MGRSGRSKTQKKIRAAAIQRSQEEFATVPHTFIFHRGQVGQNVHKLITDLRRLMEPYTARALKVRKRNLLKDFVAVAGPLGVTHFLIFTKSSTSVNFKIARLPRGPTLTFKVHQYSLVKDVVSSLKRHRMHEQQFYHHALLVLSNFGGDGMHIKLMATVFQNMFPSINVYKVGLNAVKRCVLINYNSSTQRVDIRHYSIKVIPVGMSRGVKKLLQEKFPNMSRFEDISDLLMKGANLSESEAEQDGEHNITELPQVCAGRGNLQAQQSAIRLTEIGPRLSLELVKIQEGMCDGQVMYHSFIQKTEEELQELLQQREKRQKLKEERRKKQEGDIRRKQRERELHKKRSLAGMGRNVEGDRDEEEVEDPCTEEKGIQSDQDNSDSDREYYRQEVGIEPDDDLFPGALQGKRKRNKSPQLVRKRAKGPERAPSKKATSSDSGRSKKRRIKGRKHRLIGTHLINSKFMGSALKGKAHQGLSSKAKGQPQRKHKMKKSLNQESPVYLHHEAILCSSSAYLKKGVEEQVNVMGVGLSLMRKHTIEMSSRHSAREQSGLVLDSQQGPSAKRADLCSLSPAHIQHNLQQQAGTSIVGMQIQRLAQAASWKEEIAVFGNSLCPNRLLHFLSYNHKEDCVNAKVLKSVKQLKMAEGAKTWSNGSFADIQKALLPPIFGIEFICAFTVNSLAIWFFLSRVKVWHTGIIFAFTLAVNDLVYVTTLPLLIVYYANDKDWIFGQVLCKIERFLFTCNLYGSTFLITSISINRYLGIVHPLFTHRHIQPKHARVASLLVWALSIAITSPTFVFSEVTVTRNTSECLGSSSDEQLPQYFSYSLFLAVFGCALPFAMTSFSYICIFWKVHSSQTVDSSDRRQVALLVCAVLVLYIVSFIPFTILRNVNLYRRLHGLDLRKSRPIYTIYQVSKCLLTLSMCVHPLVYAAVLNNVREICHSCTWHTVSTEETQC